MRIGIAGAGLLGRLAAWTLARAGHEVSVFDPAGGPDPTFDGHGAAGFTAAGMLSPLAESDTADAAMVRHGWASIEQWARITGELATRMNEAPALVRHGSLLVAHGPDLGAARRLLARLPAPSATHLPERLTTIQSTSAPTHRRSDIAPAGCQARPLDAAALAIAEPALHSATGTLHAWLLPGEAHIDTVQTMQCLHDDAPGVAWHWRRWVTHLSPGRMAVVASAASMESARRTGEPPASARSHDFDCVFDLRGVGARPDCAVRGVRGEMVWLHAPGLDLRRAVRLLHPRHRVYIVPRPGDIVLVGASEIETEDRSPMSLRSAVELMAAAHSVLPALGEARIVRMDVNLRPALPDHRPHCHVEPGLVRINGLYRHGWLLAPSLLDDALRQAGLLTRATRAPQAPQAPQAS